MLENWSVKREEIMTQMEEENVDEDKNACTKAQVQARLS